MISSTEVKEMEVVKYILENYWQTIVAVIIFIISFILQLLKKKPLSDVYSDLFKWCLKAVLVVEADKSLIGSDKKLCAAIDLVKYEFGKKYEPEICYKDSYVFANQYEDLVINIIESILSTPQRHDER